MILAILFGLPVTRILKNTSRFFWKAFAKQKNYLERLTNVVKSDLNTTVFKLSPNSHDFCETSSIISYSIIWNPLDRESNKR